MKSEEMPEECGESELFEMCVAGLLIDVLQLFSARLMTECATAGSPEKHAAEIISFVPALRPSLMTIDHVLTLFSIYTDCLG